jgi:CYTH domain-containing protein
MFAMEIERKFTIKSLPAQLDSYPHSTIEQAYLCTNPVMRIRRHGDKYIFTYKGSGLMVREEHNLPLTKEAYEHLLPKADGNVIRKTRYNIPIEGTSLIIELDLFESPTRLIMAEVEFPDEASALAFTPPDWFDKDVTNDPRYHNSNMI